MIEYSADVTCAATFSIYTHKMDDDILNWLRQKKYIYIQFRRKPRVDVNLGKALSCVAADEKNSVEVVFD